MKRIAVVIISLMAGVLLAQTESPKDALLNKLVEKYKNVNEISVVMEMNMSMMGSTMKVPIKLWTKGGLARADSSVQVPGVEQKMEQIMLNDGKTISMYSSMNNTIMTIDLSKLPDEIKSKMNRGTTNPALDVEILNKIKDKINVEETTRGGKKLYLITINDIESIKSALNMPAGNLQPGGQLPFKKIVYMIDFETLLPVKLEIYADGDTPGMWIDFIDVKIGGVPDSIFDVKFPQDAKKIDMTDSIKNLGK